MPGVLHVWAAHWSFDFREVGKSLVVGGGNLAATLIKLVTLLELFDAQACGKIGEIVFEAGTEDFVVPGTFGAVAIPSIVTDAVQAEHAYFVRPLRIFRGGHAALAGGDRFRRVKRKTSDITDRADA